MLQTIAYLFPQSIFKSALKNTCCSKNQPGLFSKLYHSEREDDYDVKEREIATDAGSLVLIQC